jgi:hypothetical protein
MEGCYFVSVFLYVFLSLRDGSSSFRYQMVCDIHLEIIIPHLYLCVVIYDLQGSNDADPQDADSTLVGEIYFP